jgi:hypothetical protein
MQFIPGLSYNFVVVVLIITDLWNMINVNFKRHTVNKTIYRKKKIYLSICGSTAFLDPGHFFSFLIYIQ